MLPRPAGVIKKLSKPKRAAPEVPCASTPGPHDFATCMDDWRDQQRRSLGERLPGSLDCLEEVMEGGLDVSTHSGTGAAEMACATVAPGRVRCHVACDINPTCRKVLLQHSLESSAEHVSEDLCKRPPSHIVEEL